MDRVTTCLWFDTEGEEAAEFYCSLIPNSRITNVSRYGSAGPREEGAVMTVNFELNGVPFFARNGGPEFTFTEAMSLQVVCDDQAEVDRMWDALTADGGRESRCGWLKDRFGLSWQIVPRALMTLTNDPDREKAQRVMQAMLGMQKIDVAELERAAGQ